MGLSFTREFMNWSTRTLNQAVEFLGIDEFNPLFD